MITFGIAPGEEHGAQAITPWVDGERLDLLVERFEQKAGFDPAGGYGGLVPEYRRPGPLETYFGIGGGVENPVAILACSCGEVGCWPLEAEIQRIGDTYRWTNFRQPHRPRRDYAAFGPLVFDARQYEAELRLLGSRL